MGIFAEIDAGYDGSNYSDTNNYTFDNADLNSSIFNSDTLIQGDGTYNTIPLVSDPAQSSSSGNSITWGSTQNLLGSIGSSIGSIIKNAPAIGSSLGTAVGTAEHNIQQAGTNYTAAENAAKSGNNLGTWWIYASTTDKLMVGLAIVGIIVALKD